MNKGVGSVLSPPIFLALDLDDKDSAIEMARAVSPYVGGFKLGPRLCVKYGSRFISELTEWGPVFVDNKYFDIPSAMESAIRTTFNAGATFATVHATCGPVALRRLAELERELNSEREFKILAVTVLTSFDSESLPANWSKDPIARQVESLAKEVVESGLSGLVCSTHEVQNLSHQFPGSFLVTPGIRFPTESQGDQVRILGPRETMEAGASALVVGRPIYRAENPVAAAKRFSESVGFNHKP